MNKINLNLERHDALVHFHLDSDSGDWFAVACARGVMQAIGRKVSKGEKLKVEILISEKIDTPRNTELEE